MIALIQRVKKASVSVEDAVIGEIGMGLLAFLAIEKTDTRQKADKLIEKILNYRVFADQNKKMNLSLQQIKGELLVISQFTLTADTQKGLRPSFSNSPSLQFAENLYTYFIQQCRHKITFVAGKFQADMSVSLVNDGPVTFWLQT